MIDTALNTSAPVPRTRLQLSTPWLRLFVVLVAGLAIRLSLTPYGQYVSDALAYRFWALRMLNAPLTEFYANIDQTPVNLDHLPGDMWILLVCTLLYRALVPDPDLLGPGFVIMLKLVAVLADVGIGLLLFLIGRRLGGRGAGLVAATLFMLNPASIFLSAVWVAWDSVSTVLAVLSLWLVLRGAPEWALPVLTYAALIKPPLILLAPAYGLAFLHRYLAPHTPWAAGLNAPAPVESLGRSLSRAVVAAVASVVILIVTLTPFGVGLPPLPPTGWSIFDQLTYAFTRFPYAWLNAFNVWALLAMQKPLEWPSDQQEFLGLTYQAWGALLWATTCATLLIRYARRGDDRALVWVCMALMFASFMLPTRMHPRYLLPTLVLAALAPVLAPRLRWLAVALTVTFLANLLWNYNLYFPLIEIARSDESSDVFIRVLALANVVLLSVVVLCWPRGGGERGADGNVDLPQADAEGRRDARGQERIEGLQAGA